MTVNECFSDYMVLPVEKPLPVSGFSTPGSRVTVTLGEDTVQVTVAADGSWRAVLPPQKPGREKKLVIQDEAGTTEFLHVSTGLVFLAAGQSNMEFPVSQDTNGADLAGSLGKLDFSVLHVPCPEDPDQPPESVSWKKADSSSRNLSAVACYAVQELRKHTDLPIGLIVCCKGGTSASCWVEEEILRENPSLRETYLDGYWLDIQNQSEEEEDRNRKQYFEKLEAYNKAVEAYKKKWPERSVSRLKKDLGHTPWPMPKGRKDFGRPCGLWHTMFQRIQAYPLSGVWWYQGEEDAKTGFLYKELLQSLIAGWRKRLGCVPFFLVSLPSYRDDVHPEGWVEVRQAQMETARTVPDCILVETIDTGEEGNIHPVDKSVVGFRLGRKTAGRFGFIPEENAPEIQSAWREGKEIRIRFDQSLQPLQLKKEGFSAETAGKELIVRTDQKEFSYNEKPWCTEFLYGQNGLPVMPFHLTF